MGRVCAGLGAICLVIGLALAGCADDQAPRILWASFPPDTSDPVGPYSVEAVVEDNCCLEQVDLLVSEDLEIEPDRLPMQDLGEGHHGASFGGFPVGTVVWLAIEARDAHGNRTRYPRSNDPDWTGCEPDADGTCWVRFEVIP